MKDIIRYNGREYGRIQSSCLQHGLDALAADFAWGLIVKIVRNGLYIWPERGIAKDGASLAEDARNFLRCLERADGNGGKTDYRDETYDLNTDLYGQTDTYGRYGFAEAFACLATDNLGYCVYGGSYKDEECKATALITEEAYRLAQTALGLESAEQM